MSTAPLFCIPTSLIPFRETEHGRLRRRQRGIDKKDLQRAMKYGVRCKNVWQHKRCPTSCYRYENITYIVNDITGEEVTSYTDPLTLDKVKLDRSHAYTAQDPSTWTSNTVIVVDTSGSMRESDVWGTRNRLQAVWLSIALDVVAQRLESGAGRPTDIVSIVTLSDKPSVVIEEMSCSWQLYNIIVAVYNDKLIIPAGEGPFIPSLRIAEELLTRNMNSSCALGLIFLSDGVPSDRGPNRFEEIQSQVGELSSTFGRRLTFTAIGIGDKENFGTLENMVKEARDYDVKAQLHLPSLTSEAIGVTFTSSVTSTMETQRELTNLNTLKQKQVRNVSRESKSKAAISITEVSTEDFWIYPINKAKRRVFVEVIEGNKRMYSYPIARLQHAQAMGVAMSKKPFGEGAERFAYRFYELAADLKTIVGSPLVAKESRFVQEADVTDGVGSERERKAFAQTFCRTQQMAALMAKEFNKKMDSVKCIDKDTPRIRFLHCSIYELVDNNLGLLSVLVEEKLDQEKWQKWNSNDGFIQGVENSSKKNQPIGLQDLAFGILPLDLDILEEGSEEDEDSSDEEQVGNYQTVPKVFSPGDVAQAFSHFSYKQTNRRRLVCDVQGVYDDKSNMLLLSDPVIHYYNPSQRDQRRVHGRTDRGCQGFQDFFDTHKEVHGHLCKLMLSGFPITRNRSRRP